MIPNPTNGIAVFMATNRKLWVDGCGTATSATSDFCISRWIAWRWLFVSSLEMKDSKARGCSNSWLSCWAVSSDVGSTSAAVVLAPLLLFDSLFVILVGWHRRGRDRLSINGRFAVALTARIIDKSLLLWCLWWTLALPTPVETIPISRFCRGAAPRSRLGCETRTNKDDFPLIITFIVFA